MPIYMFISFKINIFLMLVFFNTFQRLKRYMKYVWNSIKWHPIPKILALEIIHFNYPKQGIIIINQVQDLRPMAFLHHKNLFVGTSFKR
jgi:hypothetical protein